MPNAEDQPPVYRFDRSDNGLDHTLYPSNMKGSSQFPIFLAVNHVYAEISTEGGAYPPGKTGKGIHISSQGFWGEG